MVQKYYFIILLGILFGVLSLNADDAYSETIQWTSDFTVGILNSESSEFGIDLKVSTFDKNAIILEWSEPDTDKIDGYQILRKTLDTEYIIHIENTNTQDTSFVDENLQKGYYDYKIIPVTQKPDPQIISKHGIDREHSLFEAYLMGQELLAKAMLEQSCPTCFEKPFSDISKEIIK